MTCGARRQGWEGPLKAPHSSMGGSLGGRTVDYMVAPHRAWANLAVRGGRPASRGANLPVIYSGMVLAQPGRLDFVNLLTSRLAASWRESSLCQ